MQDNTLSGRTAIVTGAAGGIGTAIATALHQAGATVVAADLNGAAAEAVAQTLRSSGGSAATRGISIDVTDSAQVRAVVDEITTSIGPIDVLVNNAGIDKIEPFVESTEATWRKIMSVNFLGPVICARAVIDGMLERGSGRIISISSDAGKVGSSGEVVYSGTKGGIIAFSKALARETAASGVTVNCVCPGPTDTPLLDQIAERSQKMYDSLARAVPMKRIGKPSDIAPMVAFLAGDGGSFITGQAISVSGGLTMA